MGLDMYLAAQTMLHPKRDQQKYDSLKALFPEVKTHDDFRHIEVKFDIGYWRKANHIHKWFVDNVQNKQDDQGDYCVDCDELKTLLTVCKKVDADHSLAEELLPTTSGFFFGNTNYDNYYFNDIQNTIKIIENALALPDDKYDFKYNASW